MNIQIPENAKRHVERVVSTNQSQKQTYTIELENLIPVGYVLVCDKQDVQVYRAKDMSKPIEIKDPKDIWWRGEYDKVVYLWGSYDSITITDYAKSDDVYKLCPLLQLLSEVQIPELIGSSSVVIGKRK